MPLEKILGKPWVKRILPKSVFKEMVETVHYARIAKHAMNHIKEGLIYTDLENNITLVNQGFLDMYGYESSKELVGENISILRDNNEDSGLEEILPATMASGWTGEVWNKTKDGRRILVELSTSAVPDFKGEPYRLMGITRDITEKRQDEKMANIGQFSAKIIHDINGILMPILGYSDNIVFDPRKPELVQGIMGRIHKSAKRMERLVTQLGNFAKRDEINIGKIYLHHVVDEVEDLFAGHFEDKTYILTIKTETKSMVNADPSKVSRVLQNLVTNAINAMKNDGKVNVSLYDHQFEHNYMSRTVEIPLGKYVALSVEDNGPGIPDEVAKNMFDPFYTTNNSKKSSGLGLAIVRDCIQVHPEAYLDYETTVGEGTTFTVYFKKVE
jgi:PAS domain S-box-containing protein